MAKLRKLSCTTKAQQRQNIFDEVAYLILSVVIGLGLGLAGLGMLSVWYLYH